MPTGTGTGTIPGQNQYVAALKQQTHFFNSKIEPLYRELLKIQSEVNEKFINALESLVHDFCCAIVCNPTKTQVSLENFTAEEEKRQRKLQDKLASESDLVLMIKNLLIVFNFAYTQLATNIQARNICYEFIMASISLLEKQGIDVNNNKAIKQIKTLIAEETQELLAEKIKIALQKDLKSADIEIFKATQIEFEKTKAKKKETYSISFDNSDTFSDSYSQESSEESAESQLSPSESPSSEKREPSSSKSQSEKASSNAVVKLQTLIAYEWRFRRDIFKFNQYMKEFEAHIPSKTKSDFGKIKAAFIALRSTNLLALVLDAKAEILEDDEDAILSFNDEEALDTWVRSELDLVKIPDNQDISDPCFKTIKQLMGKIKTYPVTFNISELKQYIKHSSDFENYIINSSDQKITEEISSLVNEHNYNAIITRLHKVVCEEETFVNEIVIPQLHIVLMYNDFLEWIKSFEEEIKKYTNNSIKTEWINDRPMTVETYFANTLISPTSRNPRLQDLFKDLKSAHIDKLAQIDQEKRTFKHNKQRQAYIAGLKAAYNIPSSCYEESKDGIRVNEGKKNTYQEECLKQYEKDISDTENNLLNNHLTPFEDLSDTLKKRAKKLATDVMTFRQRSLESFQQGFKAANLLETTLLHTKRLTAVSAEFNNETNKLMHKNDIVLVSLNIKKQADEIIFDELEKLKLQIPSKNQSQFFLVRFIDKTTWMYRQTDGDWKVTKLKSFKNLDFPVLEEFDATEEKGAKNNIKNVFKIVGYENLNKDVIEEIDKKRAATFHKISRKSVLFDAMSGVIERYKLSSESSESTTSQVELSNGSVSSLLSDITEENNGLQTSAKLAIIEKLKSIAQDYLKEITSRSLRDTNANKFEAFRNILKTLQKHDNTFVSSDQKPLDEYIKDLQKTIATSILISINDPTEPRKRVPVLPSIFLTKKFGDMLQKLFDCLDDASQQPENKKLKMPSRIANYYSEKKLGAKESTKTSFLEDEDTINSWDNTISRKNILDDEIIKKFMPLPEQENALSKIRRFSLFSFAWGHAKTDKKEKQLTLPSPVLGRVVN